MSNKIKTGVVAFILAVAPLSVFAQGDNGLTPYGQVRAYFGEFTQSKEITHTSSSDTDYASKFTSARLGVKGTWGDIDAVGELGVNGYSYSSNSVNTRKLYALWHINKDAYLEVGQDNTPYYNYFFNDNITFDNCLGGFGATNAQRDLQIKFSVYGFFIDILNPYSPSSSANGSSATLGTNKIGTIGSDKYWDITIPKISIGYDFKSSDTPLRVLSTGVVYQTTKVDKSDGANVDAVTLNGKSVNAFLAFAFTHLVFGDFSIDLNAGYGINDGIIGIDYTAAWLAGSTSTNYGSQATAATAKPGIIALPTVSGSGFKNTTTIEGDVQALYDFKVVKVGAGIGYVQAKNSQWAKTDAQITYYGQVIIPLVKDRINLIPEVEEFNYLKDKNGNKEGTEFAAGALIQIIF